MVTRIQSSNVPFIFSTRSLHSYVFYLNINQALIGVSKVSGMIWKLKRED